MIVPIIPARLINKTGRMMPVIKNRPNLRKIDMSKVTFLDVPSSDNGSETIEWKELVALMQQKLREGLLTLGSREWISIFCNDDVNEWLKHEPRSSPWKFGNGGLIGFPDGLLKLPSKHLSYDVAIWIPKEAKWHMRIFSAKNGGYPDWYTYLRLPAYPLKHT